MQPTRQLPGHYHPTFTIDLVRNTRLALGLNAAALAAVVAFGIAFTAMSRWLRPSYWAEGGQGIFGLDLLTALLSLVFMLLLHEGLHGLFFLIFTRELPVFGLNPLYAYAAAPDWYLPRRPYLMIGLAPFLFITILGISLIPFAPAYTLPALLFTLTLNAGGSVGDMYIMRKVAQAPQEFLINDAGVSITLFGPAEAG